MNKIIYLLFTAIFTLIGNAQNALSFDGIDDKVDLGNPANLQLLGTSLTIEAWIYPTSWRTNVWEGDIVVKEQNNHGGYMFRAGDNGKLNFAFGNGTTWNELTTTSGALSLNTWQHVAATYDGVKVRLYKNGVRIDSINYSSNLVGNANSCVIGGWSTTGRNFPGKIDEVRIWDVVRSQAQIAASMNGEFCGGTTGLQAYYKFNQGTAGGSNTGLTTLTDFSGNNTTGTLQNFNLSGSSSNWVTGKSLSTPTGGSGTTSVTACDSYTSPSGNYTWTTNGTYIDTIVSPLGCDSILTINLTIESSNTGTLTATACNSYKSPSGNHTWTTSGTYTDILVNAVGCDSVLIITLTINAIDTTVLQNGTTLTSWATGATYQWFDCDTKTIIPGATNQSFFPTANGTYGVIVTDNNCSDTSACYTVTGIGIDENGVNEFAYYPNPATDILVVELNGFEKNATILISNLTGQVVFSKEFYDSKFKLDLNEIPSGMYTITVRTKNTEQTQKLLVK